MALDRNSAVAAAQRYFHTTEPLKPLGWGVSGFVYLSPDLRSAVKVHRYVDPFDRELLAYHKLQKHRVEEILGLSVPRLRGWSREALLIHMDVVRPPYLLDFAGVSFEEPDFPEDALEIWRKGLDETYGPNIDIIYGVYNALRRIGIYYLDFRPSNVRLDGLPGLIQPDPPSDDQS